MAGRKRISSELGEKRVYSFWLYPSEFQQMKIMFNKIKARRKMYETKHPNVYDLKGGKNETIE